MLTALHWTLSNMSMYVWLCLCALFCSFSCTVMTANFNNPFILKMPMASISGIFLRRELLQSEENERISKQV